MLVLAMEFSRCAQRPHRATDIKVQTDEWVRYGRASGRSSVEMRTIGVASEGGIAPGCSRRAGTEGHSLKTE